jgi:ribonuclease P protein component
MQREQRLRRRKDFSAVYSGGRAWSNHYLAARVLPRDTDGSRFGFAVGKRVGNAVVRNRVKRRLRAVAAGLPVRPGWDIVVVARPAAATAGFTELAAALRSLLNRARVLGQPAAGANAKEGVG